MLMLNTAILTVFKSKINLIYSIIATPPILYIPAHKTPVSDKYKDTAVQDGHTYGMTIRQQDIEIPFFVDKIIR